MVYTACEACSPMTVQYAYGYKIFSQQLMEKHLSAGFVIHNSISDSMLDGHLTLLSTNVSLAGLVTRI